MYEPIVCFRNKAGRYDARVNRLSGSKGMCLYGEALKLRIGILVGPSGGDVYKRQAQMVLTTESLVADKKEPAPAAPAMPADGGMGGMY